MLYAKSLASFVQGSLDVDQCPINNAPQVIELVIVSVFTLNAEYIFIVNIFQSRA
jgi:hypothetical protein